LSTIATKHAIVAPPREREGDHAERLGLEAVDPQDDRDVDRDREEGQADREAERDAAGLGPRDRQDREAGDEHREDEREQQGAAEDAGDDGRTRWGLRGGHRRAG
jgi:hypothetical protein